MLFTISLYSQNKENEANNKGVETIIIKTKNGNITVYLPSNIHSGDIISGTVISDPTDRNKKKKNSPLQKNISVFGNKIPLSKSKFSIKIPNEKTSTFDENDIHIPISESPRDIFLTEFNIPNYFRAGYPQKIKGGFDGDFKNSKILLNDKVLDILTESPQEIVVQIPPNISGKKTLEILENDIIFFTEIACIDLNMTAGKTNLFKGESTNINIEIIGLQYISEHIVVIIENLNTQNVHLEGGEIQNIIINPLDAKDGVFTKELKVTANLNGNFSIKATIIEPDSTLVEENINNYENLSEKEKNLIIKRKEIETAIKDANNMVDVIKLQSKIQLFCQENYPSHIESEEKCKNNLMLKLRQKGDKAKEKAVAEVDNSTDKIARIMELLALLKAGESASGKGILFSTKNITWARAELKKKADLWLANQVDLIGGLKGDALQEKIKQLQALINAFKTASGSEGKMFSNKAIKEVEKKLQLIKK